MCLCVSGAMQAQNSQPNPPKAYIVSDAHLDTQWNWDIQTTIQEYVWNTLNQNLFLLRKYPDYVFNFEGAVKYSWMKEYFPTRYDELKQRIKEGRWHVTGSSWDACDVLVPSAESVLRNILYGQNYYRTEFGTEGTDIFLPDCFGFGWTLPSLAHHCGLIGFSSQKLGWRNHPFYGDKKYPFTIGLWKGIDGSQLMFAHGYDYGHRFKDEDLSKSEELKDLLKDSPLNTVYRYYGTGDMGGSPTITSVRAVEKGVKGTGDIKVVSATSDQLYKDYAGKHDQLPVFDGELLMDVHGTGCYTSQAAMKWYNRQNELLGDAAERAAVAAEWLNQGAYPKSELETSWKRFLFHQFHDDLTGTSIPRAYEFSWNDELISLKQFSDVLTSSVNEVSRLLDTNVKGTPVVLYNALGFAVNDLAEMEVEFAKAPKGISVYNAEGKKVASQYLGYKDGKAHLLVEASVPATGYAVYDVRTSGEGIVVKNKQVNTLENSCYKLTFDANGDIVSLLDKRNGKELVASGKAIRLALFTENESYEWPAWEILKKTLDREPVSITDNVKLTLVEDGELRKSLCIEKKHGESVFRQYVRLYEGTRASRIDFYNEIDWRSTNALLKAEFPLAVSNPNATYDLSLGSVQRGNNTVTAYEVYGHYWADLTDRKGDYGVSIMNNGKYGWDKSSDNTLRLTLLHTPKTNKGYTYQDRQDFGYHTFTYSLLPHQGELNKAEVVSKAEVLNQRLKAFQTDKHKGEMGRTFSMVSSDNPNVIIKALKKAVDSDEYVVRVYDVAGQGIQSARLTFAGKLASVVETDGTEKEIAKADFSNNTFDVKVNPFSLKTYKIRLAESGVSAYQPKCLSLELPYDKKCATYNEFRSEADFESGYSYAAELLPDSITIDQVTFRLGEPETYNGLSCKNDTIEIPEGYNRLYFLAAAASSDDQSLQIACGKHVSEFVVPSYTGFVGQWGHEGHTSGYLKPAQIAYVGTHRHASSGDCPYEFTYMFKFGMDIPKGVHSIVLPKNENVVIFAATAVAENHAFVKPLTKLFLTNNREEVSESVLGKKMISGENLLKNAKLTKWSNFVNEEECPQAAIDGDLSTKWCDIAGLPSFLEFDLGKAQQLTGWKVVNAGKENGSFITSQCFLMGRNAADEDWQTIDYFDGNRSNVVLRTISSDKAYRYLRMVVTRGTQTASSQDVRIYEVEVY
ncbi:glycoside hydrolase family 38 C-terminal domain-containing protein [uncultured Bacteroides sp.]|uniref:glycoside hydrolase family 38 N-terminal domain-containing protein n=1 Tax=uncultured Bacteroides sp. TaxID=162156 RepID=UPI002666FDAF|nr:glycoside hydrolase family 38 C-terminal domain-containing protein [uncultured Bacteroides sp.]